LAVTYILGGVINFIASALLKRRQTRFRDKTFEDDKTLKDEGTSYKDARSLLYQKASPDNMRRIRSDGHIIRVFRSSILNFLCLAGVLIPYIRGYTFLALLGIVICVLLSVSSFFLWKERYESSFTQMLGIYKEVKSEKDLASSTQKTNASDQGISDQKDNDQESKSECSFSLFSFRLKR
jgi:hypothetical protein